MKISGRCPLEDKEGEDFDNTSVAARQSTTLSRCTYFTWCSFPSASGRISMGSGRIFHEHGDKFPWASGFIIVAIGENLHEYRDEYSWAWKITKKGNGLLVFTPPPKKKNHFRTTLFEQSHFEFSGYKKSSRISFFNFSTCHTNICRALGVKE